MPIIVTNLTPTRSFNPNDVSLRVLANVAGTLITDIQSGNYDGTQWQVSSGNINRQIDANNLSPSELAHLFFTIISDNPNQTALQDIIYNFDVLNVTINNVLNCNSVSLNELADIVGTFKNAESVKALPDSYWVQEGSVVESWIPRSAKAETWLVNENPQSWILK